MAVIWDAESANTTPSKVIWDQPASQPTSVSPASTQSAPQESQTTWVDAFRAKAGKLGMGNFLERIERGVQSIGGQDEFLGAGTSLAAKKGLEIRRAREEQAAREHPTAAFVGSVVGAALNPLTYLGGASAHSLAASGTALGALEAFGDARGTPREQVQQTAEGGLEGGALGLGMAGAGKALGAGGRALNIVARESPVGNALRSLKKKAGGSIDEALASAGDTIYDAGHTAKLGQELRGEAASLGSTNTNQMLRKAIETTERLQGEAPTHTLEQLQADLRTWGALARKGDRTAARMVGALQKDLEAAAALSMDEASARTLQEGRSLYGPATRGLKIWEKGQSASSGVGRTINGAVVGGYFGGVPGAATGAATAMTTTQAGKALKRMLAYYKVQKLLKTNPKAAAEFAQSMRGGDPTQALGVLTRLMSGAGASAQEDR